MNDYHIAAPLPEHLPALMDIERQAASLFPPDRLPAGPIGEGVPLETLRTALEENRIWTARQTRDDKPVGFALLELPAGLALLAELDVLPAHGRKGIGRALVHRTATEAAKRGFHALYLTTFADLPWNAPFYEKLGFLPLTPTQTPAPIAEILTNEQRLGLKNRLAMRLALPREQHA